MLGVGGGLSVAAVELKECWMPGVGISLVRHHLSVHQVPSFCSDPGHMCIAPSEIQRSARHIHSALQSPCPLLVFLFIQSPGPMKKIVNRFLHPHKKGGLGNPSPLGHYILRAVHTAVRIN